jgi:hypothetical protein
MFTNTTAANYALSVKNEGTSGTRNLINFYEGTGGGSARANISLDGSANFAITASTSLVFSPSSAEGMRLTSTGLGIGTSSPSYKLDVVAASSSAIPARLKGNASGNNNTQLRFAGNNSGTDLWAVGTEVSTSSTGTAFDFYDLTASANRMRLDSSGNLGLGVTPNTWTSVKAIEMGELGSAVAGGGNNILMFYNSYFNSGFKYARTGAASYYQQTAGTHVWTTAASGTAGNAITFTQAMTLDASGNLFLGVTSSAAGRLAIKDVAGSGNNVWLIGRSSDGTSSVSFRNNADTAYNARIECFDTGVMTFGTGTSATERARIDSSGRFMVGKTSSSDSVAGLQLQNFSGTAGTISCIKTASGQATAWGNYHSGTYVGGMEYTNTATSFPTSSDSRLKKDIVDSSSASAKIDQIRIVSHGWRHDDASVEFGVIAQELYSIAPQAVTKGDDGETIEKVWGVDYSKLVPMLVKAHQEQQALIQSLKARLDAANL